MEITRTARTDALELKLTGRMDATWSDHVAGALAECVRSGQHNLVLDMAAVDYLSSAGIRVLVLYARQLGNIQGHLGIRNPSPIVRKVLELSGLDELLQIQPSAPPTTAPAADRSITRITLPEPGATAEVYELDPNATLRVQGAGNAAEWIEQRGQPAACTLVQFPANVIGIGLGSLVSGEASSDQPLGEFLAAAGAAVCQPADGSHTPDYLLLQKALQPEIKVAYGMLGYGGFGRLLRFDKGSQPSSLALSRVVQACLDASGTDAIGLAIVAETASLIGASLQKSPNLPPATERPRDIFAFPEVREWLSFTAEPAYANSTCLVVGFAASKSRGPDLRLLKPMVPGKALYGHFHAAAFPYRPLRKGQVDLTETIQSLFEAEHVLGVLHLLHDWRDLTGAGESRFLRGACWCAPITR